MKNLTPTIKHRPFLKFSIWVVLFSFFSTLITHPLSYAQESFFLPNPGTMIVASPRFIPPVIKGIKIFPDSPLRFDFIIDTGDSNLKEDALKEESTKLIKYFLATLTVPEDDLWVNLSPYEKDRIISDKFGVTEMGRDLLAQDYVLKQLTASLIYPEKELGKKFWEKVYTKVNQLYGKTDLPVNTFNKVWIVPDNAVVYERGDTAFIVKSHLKVMLECDYLALKENLSNEKIGIDKLDNKDAQKLNDVSSAIIKEVILPEIENEVNSGENFTSLRQVYNSMILATWFKRNLKESFLSKVYVGENKIAGVDIEDKEVKEKIYQQYLEAFKKGVYNYIKEDYDPATQEVVPRKYFSGGMEFTAKAVDKALLVEQRSEQDTVTEVSRTTDGKLQTVSAVLNPVKNLDRLRRILNVLAQSDQVPQLPEGASEDVILEFVLNHLEISGLIKETRDESDDVKVFVIKDEVKESELGRAIQRWVMEPRGGVKAINFKGTNGIWKIVGFESEIDQQLDLEREEIKERKQGKHWIVAFNNARRKVRGENQSIDPQSAQQGYEVARNDVMGASIGDWFKRKKKSGEETPIVDPVVSQAGAIVSPIMDAETVADEVKAAEQAIPLEVEAPTTTSAQTPPVEAVQTPPSPAVVEEQITVKTSDFDAFNVFMSDQPVGELSKPPTLEAPADDISTPAPVAQSTPTSKYSDPELNRLRETALSSTASATEKSQAVYSLVSMVHARSNPEVIDVLVELIFSADVTEQQKIDQQQSDLRYPPSTLVDTLLYLLNQGNESVLPYLVEVVQSDDQQVVTDKMKDRVLKYLGQKYYQSQPIYQALEQVIPNLKGMVGGSLQWTALEIMTNLMTRESDGAFDSLREIALAANTDGRVRGQVISNLLQQATSTQSEQAIKVLVELIFSRDVTEQQKIDQQQSDLRYQPSTLVDTLLYLLNQGNENVLPHLMEIVKSDGQEAITDGIKERVAGHLRQKGIDIDQIASIPTTAQPVPSTQRPVVSQPQPVAVGVPAQVTQPVITSQDELANLLTITRNKTAPSNDRDEAARKIRDLAYQKKDSETITALAELVFSDLVEDQRKFDPTAQTSSQEKPLKLVDALIYLLNLKDKDVLGASVSEEVFSHLVRLIQSEKFMANQQMQTQATISVLKYLTTNAADPQVRAALEQLVPEFQNIVFGNRKTRDSPLINDSLEALGILAKADSEAAFAALKIIALDKRTGSSERESVAMKLRDLAYEKKSALTIDTLAELIFSDLIDDQRKFDPSSKPSSPSEKPYKLVDALIYLLLQGKQEARPHLVKVVQAKNVKGITDDAKKRVMENLAANGEKPGVAESLVDIISSKNVPADIQKMGVPGLTRAIQSKPDALDNVLYFVIQDNYYLYFGGDIAPDTFSTEVFSKYRLLEQESILTIRRLLVKGNTRAVQEGLAQGKFTQEKVIYAMLLNKLNNIVSQTADQVIDVLEAEKKKGSRNNKGIMDGMVSLSSKLSGTPYTEKITLTGIKTALATYGITEIEESLLRRLGFRTLKNGMIIPLAFDVLLSTYRGSATFDSLDATYLTHAITTAIIKYANKGGEFAKGSGAYGANAVHEFDQGGLNLSGENGRKPDTNVSLAFSYPSDKPMPDYTRKRTMRLDANTVAGHLMQLMQWQLNERKAKQNVMKILQLIATGKINPEKLPLAIEFMKKQIEVLYDEKAVGLNKHHVDFLFGYLKDGFYEKLISQYKVGTNNRPMLNQLLVNAMKGYKVVKKLGRSGGSDQLIEHPWLNQKIQFSRNFSETITILNYLGNEEYIRKDTFDEVDLTDKTALEDFVKGAESAVAATTTAAPQATTIKLGEARTSDNTVYLFFAGRVSEGKGAEEYLNVLSEVQKKYKGQGTKIAGRVLGAVTAAYRAKLQNLARSKGIENLEFFGEYSPESFVNIMNHYPQKNCIFVHTLGLVTREAMSMGFSVVTRDSTVKQGIYQTPVSEYSQAISDLIDHPEKREQLVAASRQAAEQSFGSQTWITNMLDAVERVTGRKVSDNFKAYFTFSGFGYGKHGVNEYYNKFFRYLGKRLGLHSEVDVVSMQQRYFMGQTFPSDMYVDGVFGNGNLREFNTYQHIGRRKEGRAPDSVALRDQFIPALKDLIVAIKAVKIDQNNIFAVNENSHALTEKAVSALTRLQDYFGQGYDVSKTMLHPSVEQILKDSFIGETAGLQAHIVSYDKKGDAPTNHFTKLITLMYMLNEKMPEGKDVSFTIQLFPPVLNILHKLKGGPPVIYVEHTAYGHNEKAIIDSIDQQRYPAPVKQFMKQYIALLKMLTVHYVDGYVNPWNGNKLNELYGDFFRGQGITVPHGVDTDLYAYKEGAQKAEVPVAQSASDFVNLRNALTLPVQERTERMNLISTINTAISGVGNNRILVQGSTGRETDLPGRFDVDIIALFNRPIQGESDSTGIVAAVTRDLGIKGYRVGDIKQKPHNDSQWLISFVIYDSSGRPVTKAEITLANQKEAYPDLFNSQMRQIEDGSGSTGREAVLADIRLMKDFLQNVIESYRWYHGGLTGIGAEQLILQSGGATNNGRSIQGLGSFAKAMEWLYRQGYDGQSKTIRSLNEVKSNLKIYNVDGKNFLDNLNEWSWRRLVHAARVYTEGKQSQKVFVQPDDLRYQLADAMQYRRDSNVGAAFDFRGDINTVIGRFSTKGLGADYERVGESRYYVFVKNGTAPVKRADVEDILNQSGANNISIESQASSGVVDHAQLSETPKVADQAVLAREKATENPGGIDLNPNLLDLQTQGKGIEFNIPFDLQAIQSIQIDGFSPVIFQIIPTQLPLLLGVNTNPQEEKLSSIR